MVVDRSKVPKQGNVVLAHIKGEFIARRLVRNGSTWCLVPTNQNYDIHTIHDDHDAVVWGVVTHCVHSV